MKNLLLSSKRNAYRAMSGLLFCIFCLTSFSANAQENTDEDKTLSPYFLVLSDNPQTDQLPLKNTKADVNIVGVIADVTVTQVYKNEGKNALEAIYTFPASSNAAVYAMEMTIGTRKITAKIEEKEKARADYNQAKSEGKRVSLLEQEKPNVFQMNVANIMPGDEIKVSMKYTELLIPEKGKYAFVYPTVVGPRYSNSSSTSSNDQYVNTPYQKSGKASFYNFDIDVNLSTGMPIQNVSSSTHKVDINYPKSSQANIGLNTTEVKSGNRDFVLEYQLAGKKIESGLMLYEHGDENFFLLMVQPPKKVIKSDIPPREYIFIVDVSGSMHGFPLNVTKKLLRNLVVNLRPTDRFNIMVFAGTSGWMSDVSVSANAQNVEKAISFIDNQQGGGSTELLPAMKKALAFPRAEVSVSRSFVVVTDGYISVEKEVFDLIKNNCHNANVFTFGIGSSVNRHLIEGMAHVGMGEPLIVLNETEANIEAEKFRSYISNPVLTRVKKAFSGFDVYDVEPVSVPDVLAERPVIIYGKYKGEAKGNIGIAGYAGKKRFKKIFKVSDYTASKKNSAIRYLWARKRIQMLDDYNNLSYSDSRVAEVTKLGLKYNLMSAYTSFIAIDEEIANKGKSTTVKQALPMPEDVSDYAVGFEMEIEEDFAFFLHKEVIILSEMDKTQQAQTILDLENKLILQLNTCLDKYVELLDAITITLDKNGNIAKVEITGNGISNQIKQEIANCAMKAKYSNKLNKSLKFKVVF